MNALDIVLSGYLVFGQLIPSGQQEIVKHAGLQVIHADGAVTLRLKELSRKSVAFEGGTDTVIELRDEHYPFYVKRHVRSWNDCAAVETWVEIRHEEDSPVKLLKADSFAVPMNVKGPGNTVKILTLSGEWAREANLRESDLAEGQSVQLFSKSGTRDAWESNAAIMVSFGNDVTEERGKVLGLALEWSGTSQHRIRRTWNNTQTDVFAGIDMTSGPYTLDAGTTFTTPRAIVVWSESGKGEVSRQFHRWARRHLLPHGDMLHPILLNTWEGSYFSFTEQTLIDMMDGVKEMGGEMLVLDDGWFGHGKHARDNKNRDKAGLGDWVVNPEKLPRGLDFLAAEAAKRGLKFGLWVEPEMVNTRSHLAEAHPEWILREKHRSLALGRGGTQVVLDYTNPALRDTIFSMLDKVYDSVPSLSYIKWDCNQNIVNPGSTYLKPDRQPNLWYDYTVGYYDLLEKFKTKRPDIIVQACASGGGRMDFGALRYADEFWASDNTNPYARLFIQWGSLHFYPAKAMACHVTARKAPLKYKFDIAMMGRMGFELHPKKMSADDIAFSQAAVRDYKRIRPVVQLGDLYRLVSPYDNDFASLMYVDEKKDRAVFFVLGENRSGRISCTIRLRGLDSAKDYSIVEINRSASAHLEPPEKPLKGSILMNDGVKVELNGPFDSAVFELTAQ